MRRTLLILGGQTVLPEISLALEGQGVDWIAGSRPTEWRKALKERAPQVVLADAGSSGPEILTEIKGHDPDIQVILTPGVSGVADAVTALKMGACDFISGPWNRPEILAAVLRAFEKAALIRENAFLKDKIRRSQAPALDWGKSPAFRILLARAVQAASSDAPILVQGEPGTGKEMLARYIAENSPRAHRPFITVNCAAVPESMLETELFGREEDSPRTGGEDRGKIHQARGGTLFLDEAGELPPGIQVRLLRLFRESAPPDIRIMAATAGSLRQRVESGAFREDLFYRLNVVHLHIPPLRQRTEDLHSLASFFIAKYCRKNDRENLAVNADALRLMEGYAWPGNVRELENAIERAVLLCLGHHIGPEDLPEEISAYADQAQPLFVGDGMTLEEIGMAAIRRALKRNRGDKAKTAEDLGISLRTVYRKLDMSAARPSATRVGGREAF